MKVLPIEFLCPAEHTAALPAQPTRRIRRDWQSDHQQVWIDGHSAPRRPGLNRGRVRLGFRCPSLCGTVRPGQRTFTATDAMSIRCIQRDLAAWSRGVWPIPMGTRSRASRGFSTSSQGILPFRVGEFV